MSKPSGGGKPLANCTDCAVTLPDGRTARRETNTMPQWASVGTIFATSTQNDEAGWDAEKNIGCGRLVCRRCRTCCTPPTLCAVLGLFDLGHVHPEPFMN